MYYTYFYDKVMMARTIILFIGLVFGNYSQKDNKISTTQFAQRRPSFPFPVWGIPGVSSRRWQRWL